MPAAASPVGGELYPCRISPSPEESERSAAGPLSLAARQARRREQAARRRTRRRYAVLGTLLLVVAGAIVLTVTQLAGGDPPPQTIPPGALRVTLGAVDGRPLPKSYLGFSIEYPSIPLYFGNDTAKVNPTFVQLVRNLNPGQSPVLRFGGDSTDWSWWPTSGVRKTPGMKITLTPQWVKDLHAADVALNAHNIMGIQFEDDSKKEASVEATHLLDGLGRQYVSGFELGNEPEVYGALGWYANAQGDPVPGRPRSYDVTSWLADFKNIASALPQGVPLVGPSTGAAKYQAAVPQFLAQNPTVKTVTVHRYPLRRCGTTKADATYPTIGHLLAKSSSDGLAAGLAATAAAAHAHGATLRIDELNSVSCGGQLGVSDTMAAALWSIDTLFALDKQNVDGVNVHTFHHAWYGPFDFDESDGVWHTNVNALYYGLLAFAQAAPPGSRLMNVTQPNLPMLRVWATQGASKTVRTVIENESSAHADTIAVTDTNGASSATVTSLTAPSMTATKGFTLGGQAVADGSTTGQLTGTKQSTTLSEIQGHFVVTVPPASAVILTAPAS